MAVLDLVLVEVMLVEEAVWLVVLVMALLRTLLVVVANVVGVVLTPVCENADENAAIKGKDSPDQAIMNADSYPYFAVAAYLSQGGMALWCRA